MQYEQTFDLDLSRHASRRMNARCISRRAVAATLDYGRVVYTRGAVIHVLGRREVSHFRQHGLDLAPYEGVHVVCGTDGQVITAYRNHNLRGLKPRYRSSSSRRVGGAR